MKRSTWGMLASLALAFGPGCGGGGGGPTDEPVLVRNDSGEIISALVKIGREGGELKLPSGAGVEVPRGALTETLELKVSEVDRPVRPPDETEAASTAIAFEPHGTRFERDVTLIIPHERPESELETLLVVRLDDDLDREWDEVPRSRTDFRFEGEQGVAEVRVDRFSIYMVVRRVGAMPADAGADASVDAQVDAGPVTDGSLTDAAMDAAPSPPPTVQPRFASAGANWGRWVTLSAADPPVGSDTACDPQQAGTGTSRCTHAGVLRSAVLADFPDCTGVQITDALDAFNWRCVEGATVMAESTGLRAGRGLLDLVDPATGSWRANSISATRGVARIDSLSTRWWSNPIVVDPAGNDLSAAGTVYVLTGATQRGFAVSGNRVSLVSAAARVHEGSGTGSVVDVAGDFAWLELSAQGAATTPTGVRLGNPGVTAARFAVLHNMRASGSSVGVEGTCHSCEIRGLTVDGGNLGLDLTDAAFTTVRDLTVADTDDSAARLSGLGLHIDGLIASNNSAVTSQPAVTVGDAGVSGEGVLLQHADIVFSRGIGLNVVSDSHRLSDVLVAFTQPATTSLLVSGSRNTLEDVVVYGGGATGLGNSGQDNVFVRVLAAANVGDGIGMAGGATGVWLGATAMNNQGSGISAFGGNSLSNVLAYNNGGNGLAILAGSGEPLVLRDAALTNNGVSDLQVDSTALGQLDGIFRVSVNNPGVSSSCADPDGATVTDCTVVNGSASTTTGSVATDLVGVASVDTLNAHGAGPLTATSITDAARFDTAQRFWGVGASLPGASSRIACRTGQTCRVHDASVRSSASALRNANPAPSGNADLAQHLASASGASAECGNLGGVDVSGDCILVFVDRAAEALFDGVGNDNGLCESGEDCITQRNLGAYQGHGALATTNLLDGLSLDVGVVVPVGGVQLYRTGTNGR